MAGDQFRALVLTEEDGAVHSAISDLSDGDLPDGDVLVSVAYSSLNYKDGLAVTGKGRVVRRYPMVPGIDFAGTVEESQSPLWKPGDQVILTGWEVGEKYWGGFAQKARVRAEWLVPLPDGMSLAQAMGYGTAGFTAMLSVIALEERGLTPGEHPVLVTGAGGGVGSVAVALLARLGYHVVASTGRPELHEYLTGLGAREIIDRSTIAKPSGRPLESEHWAGAVDSVGEKRSPRSFPRCDSIAASRHVAWQEVRRSPRPSFPSSCAVSASSASTPSSCRSPRGARHGNGSRRGCRRRPWHRSPRSSRSPMCQRRARKSCRAMCVVG